MELQVMIANRLIADKLLQHIQKSFFNFLTIDNKNGN